MSTIEFLKAREEVLSVTELWLSLVMPKDVAETNGRIQTSQGLFGCSVLQ